MSDSTTNSVSFPLSDNPTDFNQRIRRAYVDGVMYFSLIDIMTEFSDTEADAKYYWRDTKKRLEVDGFELGEKISQLKLPARDGKMRLTDVANAETCLRILQSVPSPKVEPIRVWMARTANEHIVQRATRTPLPLGLDLPPSIAGLVGQTEGLTAVIIVRIKTLLDRELARRGLSNEEIDAITRSVFDEISSIYITEMVRLGLTEQQIEARSTRYVKALIQKLQLPPAIGS
ncbi:MAG: hypothetical protein ABI947_30360 [Chloroflexota bacterium]